MLQTPAIVIAAYNRPHTLKRLLHSIASAVFEVSDITLVLSIDKSDNTEVLNLCREFNWQHGDKQVIEHDTNLGLKDHIISCCNLSQQHGSIIMLEDDLMVSPHFYSYALQALQHYNADAKLAGLSLYSYGVTENKFLPFYTVADGYDNYFMQLPSSWGQVYTAQQWQQFVQWYSTNKLSNENILPGYVAEWGEKSWKKHFVQYMIEQDKYFVFPNTSHTTNCGEPGINTDRHGLYQVQLAYSNKQYSFSSLQQAIAVYDAWFEILPEKLNRIAPQLSGYDYTTDLYGTKNLSNIKSAYALSSKPCTNPIFTYGNTLPETAQNISMRVEGSFFALASTLHFVAAETEALEFYINVNPIKDVVFNQYIQHTLQAHKKEAAYRAAYPLITIAALGTSNHINGAIQNINYPAPRISLKQVSIQQLAQASNDAEYGYYIIAENDAAIDTQIIAEAVSVMQKYPDINWLTFANDSAAPLQRWNARLHALSTKQQSKRRINANYTVLSQTAWNIIAQHNFKNIDQLWATLFEKQQLYTCVSPKVKPPTAEYIMLERGLISPIAEGMMLNNMPYTRAYYKSRAGLPPLVRWAADTNSYYLADY